MSRPNDGERPVASPSQLQKSGTTGQPRGPAVSAEFDPVAHLHVTEDTSDSAWKRFEALLNGEATDFESTQSSMHVPKGNQGWQVTDTGTLPGAGERLALQAELGEVLAVARAGNRSSPVRAAWDDLYHLLPHAEHAGRTFAPPPPLPIDQSTPMQRRLRLRDQIEWAEVAGVLPLVQTFLAGLAKSEWTYF